MPIIVFQLSFNLLLRQEDLIESELAAWRSRRAFSLSLLSG